MKQPEDVQLSREEGEALIERIERNALSAEDRRLLVKMLTFYFWLLFALREAKLSLKRLKALVFGEKPKKPKPPSSGRDRLVVGVRVSGKRRQARHKECVILCCFAHAREETAAAGAWAARGGRLSGGADGGVSP